VGRAVDLGVDFRIELVGSGDRQSHSVVIHGIIRVCRAVGTTPAGNAGQVALLSARQPIAVAVVKNSHRAMLLRTGLTQAPQLLPCGRLQVVDNATAGRYEIGASLAPAVVKK
jgi:hypothetical protein